MILYNEKGYVKPMAEFQKASEESMNWWREARFGMFVHWRPTPIDCVGMA